MLTQLTICDYTLIKRLELALNAGLTVITGEAGAGKSVMLDALGLALGDRAEARAVRTGASRADITAVFDISDNPEAAAWLTERLFDDEQECFLRRVVNAEGRSRAWINGTPQPLQELRSLGELLVDLHGQHEHQSLLRRSTHIKLLDAFGDHQPLAEKVGNAFKRWHMLNNELSTLRNQQDQANQRRELLEFQLREYEELGLQSDELPQLELEQRRLSNAGEISATLDQVLTLITQDDTGNLISGLNHCTALLHKLPDCGEQMQEILQLLESATIQLEEASSSLQHERERSEADPARLLEAEARLSAIYQMARKHRVRGEELLSHHDGLQLELDGLLAREQQGEGLEEAIQAALDEYQKLAGQLSKKRATTSRKLTKQVTGHLEKLNMPQCRFEVSMTKNDDDSPTAQGNERIEFLIATLPDREPEPLARIASGGELSRISLAIQVVTAASTRIPTLAFDEVDVGIGGATADVVGQMLKNLGAQGQVLCVTHLAQVAASGDWHLRVAKLESDKGVNAELESLDADQRVNEIARMLAGQKITDNSLAHAREMLALE